MESTLVKDAAELNHQLIEHGYCLIPDVAPREMIERLRTVADSAADGASDEEKRTHRYQGSLIQVMEHPEMAELIALPGAVSALHQLGYPQPRFVSGYIISKAPEKAPPLFWHQDGFLWNHPLSYTSVPMQIFLMYYLVDTSRESGCLRVIPGSHRKRHRLHGLPEAHSEEIRTAGDDHPALRIDADEVDVPVGAGDLVIGDARLLHAAHANRSSQRRTCITLWYCPLYDQLPEEIQAHYGAPKTRPDNWSEEAWNLIEPLFANYTGQTPRVERNRMPDERLG